MNKTTRTKIEAWILADLAIEPSSYYQMLKRLPDKTHPYDFCQCLESLVAAGKIIKLKDTPNPTYQVYATN
jgi:DNA-binding PadR family transcriptional regulator